MAEIGNWIGQSSFTTGTGNISLDGLIPGYAPFSVIGDNVEVWYAIIDGDNREAGVGLLLNGELQRTKVATTFVNGQYQDDPLFVAPISLSGTALIFCTFNRQSWEEIYSFLHPREHLLYGPDQTDVDETLAPDPNDVLTYRDGLWAAYPPPVSPIVIAGLQYQFSSDTTATDPGAGFIKYNTADPNLATEMYVSATTSLGNDLSYYWGGLQSGDLLSLFGQTVNNNVNALQVIGNAVNNTGWYTIPVETVFSNGALGNLNELEVYFTANPAAELPDGGLTGQWLQKLTDADYDAGWRDLPIFSGPAAEGLVPDPVASDGSFLRDDGTWAQSIGGQSDALAFPMVFSTNTQPTDPGSGFVKVNDIDQTLATELYISNTSRNGIDVGFLIELWQVGQYLAIISEKQNQPAVDYYQIDSAPSDQTGWYLVGIEPIGGTGGIPNNVNVQVAGVANPNENIPPGGTTGQVLTKLSDANWDVYWADPTGGGGEGGIPEAPSDGNYYARRNLGWETDPVFAGSLTSGWVPDPGATELGYFLSDSGEWVVPPIQPVSTPTAEYTAIAGTTPGDPGAGNIRVNNVDPNLVTEAYVSDTTNNGNDIGFIWDATDVGDILAVFGTSATPSTNYWRVLAEPINNGTWYTLSIEPLFVLSSLVGEDVEIFFLQKQVEDGNSDGDLIRWDEQAQVWGPTSAMNIDDNGDVGIGIQNAFARLTIVHEIGGNGLAVTDGTNAILYVSSDDSNDTVVFTAADYSANAAGQFAFFTDFQERVRIDSLGYVGIGIGLSKSILNVDVGNNPAPADTADAMSVGAIFSAGENGMAWQFGVDGTAGDVWVNSAFANNQGAGGDIVLLNGGAESVRVASTGRVGINVSDTVNRFHVRESASGALPNSGATVAVENGTNSLIQFMTPSSRFAGLYFGDAESVNVGRIIYDHGLNSIQMYAGDLERMRIEGDTGHVTIGFTDAKVRLDVGGNVANAALGFGDSPEVVLGVRNSNTAALQSHADLGFYISGLEYPVAGISGTYGRFNAAGDLGGDLVFYTTQTLAGGPVERLRILNNGPIQASAQLDMNSNIITDAGDVQLVGGASLTPLGSAAILGSPDNSVSIWPNGGAVTWAFRTDGIVRGNLAPIPTADGDLVNLKYFNDNKGGGAGLIAAGGMSASAEDGTMFGCSASWQSTGLISVTLDTPLAAMNDAVVTAIQRDETDSQNKIYYSYSMVSVSVVNILVFDDGRARKTTPTSFNIYDRRKM